MTNTKTRSRRKFTAEFKAKVAMEALHYHCDGPNGSVILDSKGNEVGEKYKDYEVFERLQCRK